MGQTAALKHCLVWRQCLILAESDPLQPFFGKENVAEFAL